MLLVLEERVQRWIKLEWLLSRTAALTIWRSYLEINIIARADLPSNVLQLATSSVRLPTLSNKYFRTHLDTHWVPRTQLSSRSIIYSKRGKQVPDLHRIWISQHSRPVSRCQQVPVSTTWKVVAQWLSSLREATLQTLSMPNNRMVTLRILALQTYSSAAITRFTIRRISQSALCPIHQITRVLLRLDQRILQMEVSALKARLTQIEISVWPQITDLSRN